MTRWFTNMVFAKSLDKLIICRYEAVFPAQNARQLQAMAGNAHRPDACTERRYGMSSGSAAQVSSERASSSQ